MHRGSGGCDDSCASNSSVTYSSQRSEAEAGKPTKPDNVFVSLVCNLMDEKILFVQCTEP